MAPPLLGARGARIHVSLDRVRELVAAELADVDLALEDRASSAAGDRLLYVRDGPESRDRIRKEAAVAGLSEEEGTLRVELAGAIRGQALKMFGRVPHGDR
jgi:hypothetical protein